MLSERRFFRELLGTPEPAPDQILPTPVTAVVPFFDVQRERIWIFWRRILHTAHHRTRLTVYLRMLDKVVPSTDGPTSDVTWMGANPTTSVKSADRR
ncbi:MAG: hypothetical protein WA869_35395 [Alloacidobacterium sp.]